MTRCRATGSVLSFTEGDTMGGWWVEVYWNISPVLLISWVCWVVGSIILHELGHGLAAIRCGDRTPIELGHMTWNPKVHMGPMSLLCFAAFGFTWGLMPVSPSRFRGRYDDAIVSAAGPAVNVALFAICIVCSVLWTALTRGEGQFAEGVATFWRVGAAINCMGVVFNLLPIPPLDGHRILGTFFPVVQTFYQSERGRMIGMMAFMGLFFFLAGDIWNWVFGFVDSVLDVAAASP